MRWARIALAASATLVAACYASHERRATGTRDAGPDARLEGVCFGAAEHTLSVRPGSGCDTAIVMGSGPIEPLDPSGTKIRLLRQDLGWEDAHLRARVLRCAADGQIRLWQVSSLYSDCDNAMSWAPDCSDPMPFEHNWRWFGNDRMEAELLLAGDGARVELSLCEGGI